MCVCVCACVRACVRASVRACVRACVRWGGQLFSYFNKIASITLFLDFFQLF